MPTTYDQILHLKFSLQMIKFRACSAHNIRFCAYGAHYRSSDFALAVLTADDQILRLRCPLQIIRFCHCGAHCRLTVSGPTEPIADDQIMRLRMPTADDQILRLRCPL